MVRITQKPLSVTAVNVSNLQEVLYKKEYVEALAVQLAASTTEGILDMIMDYPEAYPTFKEVADQFKADLIRDNVQMYLEDLLADLKADILEQLKNVNIKVVSATYTEKNLSADVIVSNC